MPMKRDPGSTTTAAGRCRGREREPLHEVGEGVAPEVAAPVGEVGEAGGIDGKDGKVGGAERARADAAVEARGGGEVRAAGGLGDDIVERGEGRRVGLAHVLDAHLGAGLVGGAGFVPTFEGGAEAGREDADGGREDEEQDEAAVLDGAAHHAREGEGDGRAAELAGEPGDNAQYEREDAQEDERDEQDEQRGRGEEDGVRGFVIEEAGGGEATGVAKLVEGERGGAGDDEVQVVAKEGGLRRRA